MSTNSPNTKLVGIYHLRSEHLVQALGICAPNPRLSWRYQPLPDNAVPSKTRVKVTSGQLKWTSDWQDAEFPEITYTGPLQPRTRYDWAVELEDSHGNIHTQNSWFETGLMDRKEIVGNWIGRNHLAKESRGDFDPPVDDDLTAKVRHIPPTLNLRGTLKVRQSIASARLYSSARGVYHAFINGTKVGNTELDPGWTDYNNRIIYQVNDITEQIKVGKNTIGLSVGDGWWSGYVGFDSRRQGNHYGSDPAAWALVIITYTDGSEEKIATDDTWQECAGEIRYADLLMGEYVDRRFDLGDWTNPHYDSSAWANAIIVDSDLTKLQAPIDAPIRSMISKRAVSLNKDADGKWLIDFGQNLVGRVKIDFGAMNSGESVYLRHGEILENGRLYADNLRTAEARDVFVSAGNDNNYFSPSFTFHGFRYVEISGSPVHLETDDVIAEVLFNDTPEEGTVQTSSSDVNQLISNVRWGQRSNFVAVPTDCPQRDERLGWTADAQVFLPTACLNSDVQAFMTRWLGDLRYEQSTEGSFPDIAPVISTFFREGSPAWGDGGIIMPWHLYRVYGDKRLLKDSFDSMKNWVDFIHRNNPNLVWENRTGRHYGDWLQIDALTCRPLLATAYFAHSAELVSYSAKVLGYLDEYHRYQQLSQDIKHVFRTTFLKEDGKLESDTQTSYLLALAFDLVPEPVRPLLAKNLVAALERHNNLLTTGFIGVSLLCPVLSEIGRSDLAYSLLETDDFPSWLYSVRQGATTIWERWDGWTEHAGFQSAEMNSFNHYSLGSVCEWIYRYVAGIDQTKDSVAYSNPLIRPQIGGTLTSAAATYESPYGRISSSWQLRDDRTAQFTFSTPPTTTASVNLPIISAKMGGDKLDSHPAITNLDENPQNGVSFEILPGTYTIKGTLIRV